MTEQPWAPYNKGEEEAGSRRWAPPPARDMVIPGHDPGLVNTVIDSPGRSQQRRVPGKAWVMIIKRPALSPPAVYVPSTYTGKTPVPLVLWFHGGASNGIKQAQASGLDLLAEKEGFIVVFPNANPLPPSDQRRLTAPPR